MKHILVIVAGIAVYFLVRLKKTYRTQILLVFLGVLACVSLVFTCVNIGGTVTLTGSKNQLIHQPSFVRDGIYPDTILPLKSRQSFSVNPCLFIINKRHRRC